MPSNHPTAADAVGLPHGSVAGADAMGAYLDKASAGVYDFGSPFWADTIQYREHQIALVWFMILANHKGTPKSVAQGMYEADLEALNRAIQGDAEPVDPTVPTTAPATPA
jgi:hypothetical protein